MTWHIASLVFYVGLFWFGLHLVHFCTRRCTPSRSSLPVSSSSRLALNPGDILRTHATRVTLQKAHLHLQTTAFNNLHDSAITWFFNSPAKGALTFAYNFGSMLGVLAMLGSVSLLVWTALQLVLVIHSRRSTVEPFSNITSSTLSKRYLMSGYEPLAERSVEYRPAIHLIIPGLTVPALHLPLLVFALIFAQVVHEAGHAVTAAMEKIPLLSVGAAFTIVFPSAFVVLPSTAIEALNPTARLRVISSGAYHNLILWIFLVVFTWSHLSSILLCAIGYTDVSSYGRLVVDIDQESPLRGHIPIGAVITKIDDQSLISHNSDMDIWQLYLSRHTGLPRAEDLGWCVDREWFVAQPESCCTSSRSTNTTGLSCFVASHELPLERCINPIPLLHDTAIAYDIIRCTSLVDCGNTHVCVRLHPDQQLLRLTLHIPSWIRERGSQLVEEVVLWQGLGSEVLEEVVVGAWLPKYGFWPANLPIIADTFFTYLKMLTLSLYFFNMLPLPFLDGAQFLDALFDFFAIREISAQSEQIAMVALEGGTLTPQAPSSNSLRHFDFRRTIRILVAILIGLCVVLGIAQAFS